MQEFRIRPATDADLPEIMRLIDDTVRGMTVSEWFLPDTEAYMAAHIDGPSGFCLIAERADGRLAAYFTVKLAGASPEALGHILGMTDKELCETAQMDSCCVAKSCRGNVI